MKEKYFKNQYLEMWIEDGILFGIFAKGVTIDHIAANKIIRQRLKMCSGTSYPCYVDISQGANFTKEARQVLSEGDAMKDVNAGCIIVQNHIQKLLSMAFILLQKPSIPSKYTLSKSDALEWLSQFKPSKTSN